MTPRFEEPLHAVVGERDDPGNREEAGCAWQSVQDCEHFVLFGQRCFFFFGSLAHMDARWRLREWLEAHLLEISKVLECGHFYPLPLVPI